MYDRLNVEFDVYSGESQFGQRMVEEVKKLEDAKLIEENQVFDKFFFFAILA